MTCLTHDMQSIWADVPLSLCAWICASCISSHLTQGHNIHACTAPVSITTYSVTAHSPTRHLPRFLASCFHRRCSASYGFGSRFPHQPFLGSTRLCKCALSYTQNVHTTPHVLTMRSGHRGVGVSISCSVQAWPKVKFVLLRATL